MGEETTTEQREWRKSMKGQTVVDFVKVHEELYDKSNGHFKDKARKECQ